MSNPDPIPLSAFNHWVYCPRRCGLIHQEGEFTNNIHTMRGNAEHERIDRVAHETLRSGARAEYALPVWSEKLGLIGKCDVVEFWPDKTVHPIEYKHGPKRQWLNDDLQLAAQAVCLEEMLKCVINKGAIFHITSRRRREISITAALRKQVITTAEAIRNMLSSGQLPPPVNDRRCRECSMNQICQPSALTDAARLHRMATDMFNPER